MILEEVCPNFVNMQSETVMHYTLDRCMGQLYEFVNCNLQ